MARIDGAPAVTAKEVDDAAGPRLKKLASEEDRIRREVLRQLIEEKLLAGEAARRGITVELLLETEVAAKAAPVSDEEVAKAVAEVKARRPDAVEAEIVPRVRELLRRERAQARRTALLAELEKRTAVRVFLEAPRQVIATAGRPSIGPDAAPVTVVVFSDFQCPYCKDAAATLRAARELEGDKVRVVYRHFPLPIHPRARQAAEAAECAATFGKFWPMHDKLFAGGAGLSDEELVADAVEAGIDRDAFRRCLAGGAAKRAVEADLRAGAEAGVDGTPAVFVNGRSFSGPRTVDALRRLIDEELARAATAARMSDPPATASR